MIRPYKPEDKADLIELIRLNTPQYFDKSEEADLVNYLEHERETYFVVDEDHQIVGCGGINYEAKSTIGIISWDIIHPKYQGQGIGKKLLLHRINVLKDDSQINSIRVRTSQHTDKFYAKCGFSLEFITKDYWAKGYDLYQMKIDLSKEDTANND